jgi:hypothetical protein
MDLHIDTVVSIYSSSLKVACPPPEHRGHSENVWERNYGAYLYGHIPDKAGGMDLHSRIVGGIDRTTLLRCMSRAGNWSENLR